MTDETRGGTLRRRTFLGAASAFGGAVAAGGTQAAPVSATFAAAVPDDGWRFWCDREAAWKDDEIFLPEDVRLERLLVRPPTGGWSKLGSGLGRAVRLPTTVEQYEWGRFGSRAYTPDEYRYAADDPVPQNGAYEGVSWWWRDIEIPAGFAGRRILLNVRGARLRAEVFLNEKLVGYSILEEQPFTCDLTAAARPGGPNRLAIRITNPGGRYDWVDGGTISWGGAKIFRSHGFGGLDRGMTLTAHPLDERLEDVWVLNRPEMRTVHAFVRIKAEGGRRADLARRAARSIELALTEAEGGRPIDAKIGAPEVVEEKDGVVCRFVIEAPGARLWDLETPHLHALRVRWTAASGARDERATSFGFRWFGPDGLGSDALFRLNGRRVKLYTAISWGFWGFNGLWPTPELAVKEVEAAKGLGLNCLNFHRDVGKLEVIEAQDRMGLLRVMEPGGGKLAVARADKSGAVLPMKPEDAFLVRYMRAKLALMARTFRSHPSLVQYTLQNEIGTDLANPAVMEALEAIRAEDPSRSIVLNDGFVARGAAQAWFAPYDPQPHRSDRQPWGGWWVNHQGAGDQWYDAFYQDPEHLVHCQRLKGDIVEFGEMEGCATPDNHVLMAAQIRQAGGASYDLADHQQIVAGYGEFLDRWGFRKAFPTAEAVFRSVGAKAYESWRQYLENIRICDEVDFAAISGWESTAIENHSGVVDVLRNWKADPALLRDSLAPVRPVAKQRRMTVATGEPAIFDIYLLNDTPEAVGGELAFSVTAPSGARREIGRWPAPAQTRDRFSYLLATAVQSPPLVEEGPHRFELALTGRPGAVHVRTIWAANTGLDLARGAPLRVGVAGVLPWVRERLSALKGVRVEDFGPGVHADVIVASGLTAETKLDRPIGDETGLEAQPKKGEKPAPLPPGRLPDAVLEAVRAGAPLLVMAPDDALADGVAGQLAALGAFSYSGQVGDLRAPWMGNWAFVREHPLHAGLPADQALALHYQAPGKAMNGLFVDGPGVEVFAGYSRDHDRRVGAASFTVRHGPMRIVFQRLPAFAAPLQQRWLANALGWLRG